MNNLLTRDVEENSRSSWFCGLCQVLKYPGKDSLDRTRKLRKLKTRRIEKWGETTQSRSLNPLLPPMSIPSGPLSSPPFIRGGEYTPPKSPLYKLPYTWQEKERDRTSSPCYHLSSSERKKLDESVAMREMRITNVINTRQGGLIDCLSDSTIQSHADGKWQYHYTTLTIMPFETVGNRRGRISFL